MKIKPHEEIKLQNSANPLLALCRILYQIFNENNIAETIKKRRLRWAGHVMRSQNSLLRMVLEQNPVGKRPLRRPKLRWEDNKVKKHVEDLGGGANWKNLAIDRDGWRSGCETSP